MDKSKLRGPKQKPSQTKVNKSTKNITQKPNNQTSLSGREKIKHPKQTRRVNPTNSDHRKDTID